MCDVLEEATHPPHDSLNQDTDESASTEKRRKESLCLFKTMKDNHNEDSVFESEGSHRCSRTCSRTCLGPLTFHHQAVGQEVRLSKGGLLAERRASTFRNGLVFSSRPVRIQERILLRVEKEMHKWDGGMRVGFTNVPPSDRSLPLPQLAIPDLSDRPGHWAAVVPKSFCPAGSVMEFWVSNGGNIYIARDRTSQYRLLKGVDLSQPLWAMIDIYGKTCSILLLGSTKRQLFTRRSCPAFEHLTSPDVDNCLTPGGKSHDRVSCLDMEVQADTDSVMDCVVCMVRQARVTLSCGHRCLCSHCSPKVARMFGNCPLCRHNITKATR